MPAPESPAIPRVLSNSPVVGSLWVSRFDAFDAPVGDPICMDADRPMSIASVGKLLLLLETARQIDADILNAAELLDRRSVAPVADSGFWQHLSVHNLSVQDAATLVGGVSDNLATNVLIQRVGLGAVQNLTESLGLRNTALHDLVRDERVGNLPPNLATGTASELGRLVGGIRTGNAVSAAVSGRVRSWLATNCDLSMLAAAFDLDPLAHVGATPTLFNKTGTDTGVRVDVGSVRWECGGADFAVLTNWDDHTASTLTAALDWMRAVGRWIREGTTTAE